MTGDEATLAVIRCLESRGLPYMLVGSLSSNYYGVPRSSQDADLVVEFGSHSIADIARALGPSFRLDPQLSFETVTGTVRNVLHIDEISFQIELFRLRSGKKCTKYLPRRSFKIGDHKL